MAAKNILNIATGILSLLVLACGITFSAMVASLAKKLHENGIDESVHFGYNDYTHESLSYRSYRNYWIFGFVFIITSLVGIINAFVNKESVHIAHMLLGIITLIFKGVLFVFAIFACKALTIPSAEHGNCKTVGETCVCVSGTYKYNCSVGIHLLTLMGGILLVICIGWILTLATTVIAGLLGCKQEVQPGVIISTPMTSTGLQLAPGYLPQTHDHMQLVSNMECQPGTYGK